MADSFEANSVESTGGECDSNVSENSKVIEIHPLAFTIEFNDQKKIDEAKKSRVHERLSAFSLKHKRNPSLPDFGIVKTEKNLSVEKPTPRTNLQLAICSKDFAKLKQFEAQWKSLDLKDLKNSQLQSSVTVRKNAEVIDRKNNFAKSLKNERRNSLNDMDIGKVQSVDYQLIKIPTTERSDEIESKSDTVSEAGTYTLDREDDNIENDLDKTHIIEENENNINRLCPKKNFQSHWINDWVKDVEEQNMHNLVQKEALPYMCINSVVKSNSPGASKIPSPIHTINRKAKTRCGKSEKEKQIQAKINGFESHKHSSSLDVKKYDCLGSESSLETESFLRDTESVVAAMQNRMKLSFEGRNNNIKKIVKKEAEYKERPHPPSTASDTDTNSENEGKIFKKPVGNPFTSTRLNRAFSLRRAKADPEKDLAKNKETGKCRETNEKNLSVSARSTPSPKVNVSKPPSATPFSRTDCGRFSMRSNLSSFRANLNGQPQKKDVKRSTVANRSTSSLSSREVEFQNWRRRKSFDPMKAAAEGRKKELAKKAALTQPMSQSVNYENNARTQNGRSNPVLRSASFHSATQVFKMDNEELQKHQNQSFDDYGEDLTSWVLNKHSLLHNSPTHVSEKCAMACKTPSFNSRNSLISETHSSPSRRGKSDDLDNLVLSAINDLSQKLKVKSCNLLKKLHYFYDPNEEKYFSLKNEIAVLESRTNNCDFSPIHRATSRDLSVILKNLKGLENVFRILDKVLFDESHETHFDE